MIMGIIIASILWCIIVLVTAATLSRREVLDYPKTVLALVVLILLFGSIGYLVDGL